MSTSLTMGLPAKAARLFKYFSYAATGIGALVSVTSPASAQQPPAATPSPASATLKSNGLVNGTGDATLAKTKDGKSYVYGDYADWWLDSVKKFKDLSGVYPDYIALQNELDFPASYEGCSFLPTEGVGANGHPGAGYDKALAAVSDKLNAALGADAPKIVGPETFSIKTSNGDINHVSRYIDPATDVGKQDLSHLFGISYHLYGTGEDKGKIDVDRFRATLATLPPIYHANGVNKPMFETEFLEGESMTQVAGMIHDALTYGEASAYLVWIASRSVHYPSYALVYFDPDTGLVERRDRFYAMKAYSAFIGEGWSRIGADCSDPAVEISAFIGPGAKQLVAVLVNPTDTPHPVAVSIDGSADGQDAMEIYRSSEGDSGERWQKVSLASNANTVTLPPKSVATIRWTRPAPAK